MRPDLDAIKRRLTRTPGACEPADDFLQHAREDCTALIARCRSLESILATVAEELDDDPFEANLRAEIARALGDG